MDISQVASLLRPASNEVFGGTGKLCLSAYYLNKLNNAFETNISEDCSVSFNIVQTSNTKTILNRDLQFLLDLVQRTITLKIIPDINVDYSNVDLTRFRNIRVLEIHKLDIKIVAGVQKLRSQLQELTCCHSIGCLTDILDRCGADNSQRYSWNELRKANFSHNKIIALDDSLECTISLHTLDLSHNELDKVEFLNQLPNLKYLNISYNKLSNIPRFKGQICSRLQVLVLNNNFIEDIIGLTALSNLMQLDLSQNCLLDHKSLLSISHMVSLQCLNLQGNPISFHPHHRNITCNYLNKNSSTLKFVLDNISLNKTEKSLTGSLYPIFQSSVTSSSSNNSLNDSIQEKNKRIRNVVIEDENVEKKQDTVPIATPTMSTQHLEIKRRLEHLREEYGESWLFRDSGLLVQDVLGFEKSSVLSSTPYESAIDSLCLKDSKDSNSTNTVESAWLQRTKDNSTSNPVTANDENYETANDDSAIFSNTVLAEDNISDTSDGDDICSGGEECIYLAMNKSENDQVFVVVTETHISERDVTTSKEKARWHVNTIIGCERLEDNEYIIKIEFDTLRRNRKQRIYELEPNEANNFYSSIREKIQMSQLPIGKKIVYQCMKCSELFPEINKNALLEERPSVTCPKCKSNLVIESM